MSSLNVVISLLFVNTVVDDVLAVPIGLRAIGTAFNSNSLITTFDELNYFTNVKSTSEGAFYNCRNLKSVGLTNLTSAGYQLLRSSGIVYAWMPKVTTGGSTASQGYRAWFYNTRSLIALRFDSMTNHGLLTYDSSCKYAVYTMKSVPTISASLAYIPSKIYVPDSLVSEYQATATISSRTILPISQLPTDYPDCPWLDDLREKGFIE